MENWIEGTVAGRTDWTDQHFSLRIDCAHPGFSAGQFVRIGLPDEDEVLARPYSCVNPPHQAGVEIYLNRVPDGPLSNRLAELRVGDTLLVNTKSHGFLTLEEVPASASDLWMIATGTGVGPFLSIMQTQETWQRFEHVGLIWGVREPAQLAYRAQLEALAARHAQLHVLHCISGAAHANSYHGRVTDALSSGELEDRCQRQIDPTRSHVLLCGRKEMISDISEQLNARGLRKHLRRDPGQISSERYH